jgi:tRNA pseudouridine38-40 synthase
MEKAVQYLIGTKDFSSFAKTHTDVKTHICTVYDVKWDKTEEQIYFEISADRFLRNMVRAIVGTLLDIGTNKIEAFKLEQIIDDKNRGSASKSVSANGLFLWKVEYEFK